MGLSPDPGKPARSLVNTSKLPAGFRGVYGVLLAAGCWATVSLVSATVSMTGQGPRLKARAIEYAPGSVPPWTSPLLLSYGFLLYFS